MSRNIKEPPYADPHVRWSDEEFMQSIQTIYLSIQHRKQQALFQPVASLAYEKLQFIERQEE
jgi:hypothetical protein